MPFKETYVQSIAIYPTTTKKKHRTLCPESYSPMFITDSRRSPAKSTEALSLPSDAIQEAMVFLGKKRTTINPYSLLLLSDTHCTHSDPLPFLFSVVMAVSVKYTVSMMYIYTVHTKSQCSVNRNHLITES